jgi:hypothetical protein
MILNLRELNLSVEYNHFKMERLESAMRLRLKIVLWVPST